MTEQPVQPCRAARAKTLRGAFGERCGKPATAIDGWGRPVCAECLAFAEAAKRDVQSVGNVLADIYKRRVAGRDGKP